MFLLHSKYFKVIQGHVLLMHQRTRSDSNSWLSRNNYTNYLFTCTSCTIFAIPDKAIMFVVCIYMRVYLSVSVSDIKKLASRSKDKGNDSDAHKPCQCHASSVGIDHVEISPSRNRMRCFRLLAPEVTVTVTLYINSQSCYGPSSL